MRLGDHRDNSLALAGVWSAKYHRQCWNITLYYEIMCRLCIRAECVCVCARACILLISIFSWKTRWIAIIPAWRCISKDSVLIAIIKLSYQFHLTHKVSAYHKRIEFSAALCLTVSATNPFTPPKNKISSSHAWKRRTSEINRVDFQLETDNPKEAIKSFQSDFKS